MSEQRLLSKELGNGRAVVSSDSKQSAVEAPLRVGERLPSAVGQRAGLLKPSTRCHSTCNNGTLSLAPSSAGGSAAFDVVGSGSSCT